MLASIVPDQHFTFATSYGARRIEAALRTDPHCAHAETTLIEWPSSDAQACADYIGAAKPDILGLSAYLWSFDTLIAVAGLVRQQLPQTSIIMGGPSARPSMFQLPQFASARDYVDALVIDSGEEIMIEIVAAGAYRAEDLARIPGLLLPSGEGWVSTGARVDPASVDAFPSPYVLGLMPTSSHASFEHYRGCSIRCAFCQAPAISRAGTYSTDYLVREFSALAERPLLGIGLLSTALNLHQTAFRNLRDAEREVGLLKRVPLQFEAFPSGFTEEQLDFLGGLRISNIGIGIQTLTPGALRLMHRPDDEGLLEKTVRQLGPLADTVMWSMILGLPGDNPASFLASLDRMIDLPGRVRVAACIALPDGLLDRAPPGADVHFDPRTLRITSCAGWSEQALAETAAELTRRARVSGSDSVEGGGWDFKVSRISHPTRDLECTRREPKIPGSRR